MPFVIIPKSRLSALLVVIGLVDISMIGEKSITIDLLLSNLFVKWNTERKASSGI
jgi:hypothetical protein